MKKNILNNFKNFNEIQKSILNPAKLDNSKYSIFSDAQIKGYLKNVIRKNKGISLEIQKSVLYGVKEEINNLIPVNIMHNGSIKKFYVAKTGVCAELEKAIEPVNKKEGYFDNKINEEDILEFISENENVDDDMLIKEFGKEVTDVLNSLEEDGKIDVDDDGFYLIKEEDVEDETEDETNDEDSEDETETNNIDDNNDNEDEEDNEDIEDNDEEDNDEEGNEDTEDNEDINNNDNEENNEEGSEGEENNNEDTEEDIENNDEENNEDIEDTEDNEDIENNEDGIDNDNIENENNNDNLNNNDFEENNQEGFNQEQQQQGGNPLENNGNLENNDENSMTPEELEAFAKKTATVTLLKFYKNSTDENLKEVAAVELKRRGIEVGDNENPNENPNQNKEDLPENKAALDALESFTREYLDKYDNEDLISVVVELANQDPGKRKELKDLYRNYYSMNNNGNKLLKVDEKEFKDFLTDHYFNNFTPGDLQSYAYLLISKNPKEYRRYKKMMDLNNEPIV